jgi:hypothetical protein
VVHNVQHPFPVVVEEGSIGRCKGTMGLPLDEFTWSKRSFPGAGCATTISNALRSTNGLAQMLKYYAALTIPHSKANRLDLRSRLLVDSSRMMGRGRPIAQ